MLTNKKALSLSFVMVLVFSMMISTAQAEKTYKFTMQNMFSLNHPATHAMTQLATDVKEKSGGRLSIQVLPSGALVKGPSIFESVGMGSIDMGTTCSTYHGGILPVAAVASAFARSMGSHRRSRGQ